MPMLTSTRFAASKATAAAAPAASSETERESGGTSSSPDTASKTKVAKNTDITVFAALNTTTTRDSSRQAPQRPSTSATASAGTRPVYMMASSRGRLPAASVTRSDTSTDISSAITARMAKTSASRSTVVVTTTGPGYRTT